MRTSFARCTRMLAVALFTITLPCANAQSPSPAPATQDVLYLTVAALGTKLFDAINQCDMKAVDSMWVDDAEFYHDKNGLMVRRQNIVDAIKNNGYGQSRSEYTASTIPATKKMWARRNSSTSGRTKGTRAAEAEPTKTATPAKIRPERGTDF